MAAPSIYRSTDTNAPVLFGGPGALLALLDAILVNGYGSAFATGVLTSDGTLPADGDTVTVGSITYTFKTAIGTTPYNVLIGAAASNSVGNLQNAINGTGTVNTTYPTGTLPNPDVWANYTGGLSFPVVARKGGTAGNSLALSRASAGTPHFSVSGATLAGGGGTNTVAAAGWPKSYTDPTAWTRAAYKQPAGCGFYMQVNDNGEGLGLGRDANVYGWESMSSYSVGTAQFPSASQANLSGRGLAVRKSTTFDNAARPWLALVDDRTLYLFVASGDVTNNYFGHGFGDFYSFQSTDAYKCLIAMSGNESSTARSSDGFGAQAVPVGGGNMTNGGHYLPRNFSGLGGPTAFFRVGDIGLSQSTTLAQGLLPLPNPTDGGLYLAPLRIVDGSSPANSTQVNGPLNLRGRMRGVYEILHSVSSFADGDTFVGSADYAGRTFLIVRYVMSSSGSGVALALETTAWDTSA